MKRILLIVLWIGLLAAMSAHADISTLMRAKGYSRADYQAHGSGGSGSSTQGGNQSPDVPEPSPDTGCTLPFVLPCVL